MRIVSGIRPTGELHLGNYFGAIRDFIELQDRADTECFYFVADLHALTTLAEQREDLDAASVEVVRLYLACGIDPDKSVLYRQSDIPEIPYLAILLGMLAPEGELRRCTTYKDKVAGLEGSRQTVSLGLLAYPVLMAADILFCNADMVPVGEDQLQHLEIAREIARRFNSHVSDQLRLNEPAPMRTKAVRVPGLRGGGKMSKSTGGDDCIFLLDPPQEVLRKVKAAVTDSGPVEGQSMGQGLANLFALLELAGEPQAVAEFRARHEAGEQRFYAEMKQRLAQDIQQLLAPIQERYHAPECSEERVRQLLFENAERVRHLARQTLSAAKTDFALDHHGRGDL